MDTALVLQIKSSVPQGDEEQAQVLNCLGQNGLHGLKAGSRASDLLLICVLEFASQTLMCIRILEDLLKCTTGSSRSGVRPKSLHS